jgi:hypothetical protein
MARQHAGLAVAILTCVFYVILPVITVSVHIIEKQFRGVQIESKSQGQIAKKIFKTEGLRSEW